MKNKPPIKDYTKPNTPKLKWYTETLYVDKDTGEWIPAYKFKNEYYETGRNTNTEIKQNTAVRTITVSCKRDTQTKFDWFK
ncbi:MAG: hypothetical protein [Microviridae sp.]|nr:MAG: hypothetical protein [Microviridae sp.]